MGRHQKSKEGGKAVAMSKLAELNPDQLACEVIFAGNVLPAEALEATRRFVNKKYLAQPYVQRFQHRIVT